MSMAGGPMTSMPGQMGMSMGGNGPMPISSSGMTINAGPGSNSPHGSGHGSGPGTPVNVPMGPGSHPGSAVPMGPSSHPGMGGPSPLSMSSEKVYPENQPMVFNPQNPNAPPIYPCGICHKEVHDNDQAILCESGCNFWFHRVCTGLAEAAFHFLTQARV